jgi:VanZ family protein
LKPAQESILKAWIAAILWLGLIVFESSNLASSANTGRLLYPLLHFLLGMDLAHFAVWHSYIRKTGHFVGYFTLSLLLFRAWRATIPIPGRRWSIHWSRIAFLMTSLVASLDEWHQSYLPSRTGTFRDVVLDSSAGLIAQVVLLACLHLRGRHNREAPTLEVHLSTRAEN